MWMNAFKIKMTIKLDVFGALMEYGIDCNVKSSLIVTVKKG